MSWRPLLGLVAFATCTLGLTACGEGAPVPALVADGVARVDLSCAGDGGWGPAGVLPEGVPAVVRLGAGWQIRSSRGVAGGGAEITDPPIAGPGWCPARVPSTVVGALVDDRLWPEPTAGLALRQLPGMGYAIGENFVTLPMPASSPFHEAWWYRATFLVGDVAPGQHTWLHLDGVNYRARVWVNGQRLDDGGLEGTFRAFDLDISGAVRARAENGLAIEVDAPVPGDLAQTWVDWNPVPPDKNMGLWRDVTVSSSGPVVVRHPFVRTRLSSDAGVARLTIEAEVENASDTVQVVSVAGQLASSAFARQVTVPAHAVSTVSFDAADKPSLEIPQPALWWPATLGAPTLHPLSLEARVEGTVSDRVEREVGLREVTSALNASGAREFFINGRKLFVRGGGWARELFFRDTDENDRQQVELVKDLGLNAVRFEGTFGSRFLFDELDRQGVAVIAGWSCCDAWQHSASWDAARTAVAEASLRDMARRLREHPAVITWLYGSDEPPTESVEALYLRVLAETHWPNPAQSSAQGAPTPAGPTGFKMLGPYDWESPTYWLSDTTAGGAWGFATEIGPGASIPELPVMQALLGQPDADPDTDPTWNYHCASLNLPNTHHFNAALRARFGGWTSLADYVRKAQVLNYESVRGMFEGYSQRMDTCGGVVHWMLNSAWPSLIWHFYDPSLRTAGAYFGAKKALEPLHVQLSPVDDTVWLVNSSPSALPAASVRLWWLRLDGTVLAEANVPTMAAAQSSQQVFRLPTVVARPPLSLVFLELSDEQGQVRSTNVYWVPEQADPPAWVEGERLADFSALTTLSPATLTVTTADAGAQRREVRVTNTSGVPAFFVRLELTDTGGAALAPAFWSDNDITLRPGETRVLQVRWERAGVTPVVTASGWNTGS